MLFLMLQSISLPLLRPRELQLFPILQDLRLELSAQEERGISFLLRLFLLQQQQQ